MVKAELARQLMVRGDNEIGMLAKITRVISQANINLVALCAYSIENNVAVMFVTDDNNEAKRLLEAKGYDIQEEEVILLSIDNQPGALQRVTDKIAEAGVDLALVYGSVDESAEINRSVIISNNNLEIMMIIRTELERH
ncbi:MAG: hypothetical protein A3G91_02010 [Omnitrophica WOR_2 bacterium RIFCSPLOWO2_12_FULL_50_9]|nr:MAG: hypothetical protein A3D87_04205 [Omnitrophica WOR_2 bacterium RIFCSPHIGHO2_02_FULL_50_17]OGX43566.1 MAG: hypothetical protein A3G91_02010 [Omnitrophica WOR_2 bacterium RIFCSPLOWO2_12_FULL_50_9]